MSDVELRNQLALLVGGRARKRWFSDQWDFMFKGRWYHDPINDLNTCHILEMWLSADAPKPANSDEHPKSLRNRYRENLCVVGMMNGGPITAQARLRVQALVKTLQNNDQRTSQSIG